MALPTPVKTWVYSHSTESGGDATLCCRAVLFKIVQQMIAIGGWTCVSSSNAVAVSTGSSNWAAVGDLVWGASPHSWIVLESSALNIQLLLDLQTDGNRRSFVPSISPSKAFTGGSINTAPTASDAVSMYDGASVIFSESAVVTSIDVHIAASTDGECFRAFMTSNAVTFGVPAGWIIDKIQDAPAELTCPVLFCVGGTNINFNSATWPWHRAQLTDGDNGHLRGISPLQPGVSQHMIFSGEGREQGATSVLVNSEYDGQMEGASALGWLLLPIGIWGYSPGNRGKLGWIADLYHGSTTPATCDSYPVDDSKAWMQFGDFVQKWDGTAMNAGFTRTARAGYAPVGGTGVDQEPIVFVPNLTEPITFSVLAPPAPPGVSNREM